MNTDSRSFLKYFIGAYPGRTGAMVALLFASGLSEGVGIVALLPLLEYGTMEPGQDPSFLTGLVRDAFSALGVEPTLGPLLLTIVMAIALKAGFRWFAMREVGFVVARVAMDLRLRLIRGLMRAEWRYFSQNPTGYFANSISYEAHRAAGAYREACTGLAGVFQVLAYAAVVFLASWRIALVALVVGSGLMVGLRGFISASRTAGREQVNVLKSLVARLTEVLPGFKPIKAMALEPKVLPLLESETNQFYRAQEKQVLASETLASLQEPLVVGTLGLGLFLVLSLTSTPFSVVLVLGVLYYRLVGSMSQIQQRFNAMAAGETAFWSMMRHIEKAEAAEEQRAGSMEPPVLTDAIRLEEVSFSYGGQEILADLNLSIPAGSFVALLGPSGSGKTTLADLVTGLLRPDGGRVLVDGVDLKDIAQPLWRGRIGYVPQDLLLFHDTVFRNVALGDPNISRARVREALERAGAWDFVSSLPEGMDTVVGERGSRLSGGQRQRIAIARALVGDPQVLILDEATTALDPRTEAEICLSLVALKGRVTILAISHQAAMREVADHVYEMTGGTVRSPSVTRIQPNREGL